MVKVSRRIVTWAALSAWSNVVWWASQTTWPLGAKVLLGVVGFGFYCYMNVRPTWGRPIEAGRRLAGLVNGYELLLAAGVCLLADLAGWVWLLVSRSGGMPWVVFASNAAVGVFAAVILALGGFVRVCLRSSQVSLTTKVLVVAFWWLPPLTVVLLGHIGRTAALEYRTAVTRQNRDQKRAALHVCQTRFPVLLVHGIFFRDWPIFNYWGRIPDALTRNGATLFYGQQQSSASVADSADELARTIARIVAETGCGKVNIIAHSKGGLDARWAISRLGCADKVASLTTINTPHRGCNFARQLMQRIPQTVVASIGNRYDAMFTKLGDPDPSFLDGIADLTDTACAELNEQMPDTAGVLYQSVGSRMASRFASPFPLSLGYSLIQPLDGENDGLVAVSSMSWGNFLGVVQPSGKQGVSHGDMVDLMRKDVGDFDVCEFYVQLIAGLKAAGL